MLPMDASPCSITDMRFAAKLVKYRHAARFSQKALAETVGTSQNQIWRWENGEGGPPNMEQALRLARALRVPLDFLADDALDLPTPQLTEEERVWLGMVMALPEAERRRRLLGAASDNPGVRSTNDDDVKLIPTMPEPKSRKRSS